MADEPQPTDELEARMAALLENHQKTMADIFQTGYEKSKAIADESVLAFRQRSGVRSQILDKALQALNTVTLLLVACSCAWGAPPASYSAVIVRVSDADTFVCERSDHSQVKVRLFAVDAPEVKHRLREKDQPGGQEALKYARDNWQGKEVTVTPKGESYGRVVAEVTEKGTEKSIGLDLVAHGHAQVDQRYSKSKPLLAAESEARKEKRGLWKDGESGVIAPWDWRKQQRNVRGK